MTDKNNDSYIGNNRALKQNLTTLGLNNIQANQNQVKKRALTASVIPFFILREGKMMPVISTMLQLIYPTLQFSIVIVLLTSIALLRHLEFNTKKVEKFNKFRERH
jgi:hypothetical protein